jgi:acylphosphatase
VSPEPPGCAENYGRINYSLLRIPYLMVSELYGFQEPETRNERTLTVEAYISGKVQGVGFRACVKKIAAHLSLTGKVMNIEDGRVYLIVTGEGVIIEKLLSTLYECPRAHVREIESRETGPRSFCDFSIIRKKMNFSEQ